MKKTKDRNYNSQGKEIVSPGKAIREKCLECCNWQSQEVRQCPCTNCALWFFRFGKNPYHTRSKLSPEEIQQK